MKCLFIMNRLCCILMRRIFFFKHRYYIYFKIKENEEINGSNNSKIYESIYINPNVTTLYIF